MLEGNSSSLYPLPHSGSLHIGRLPTADIRVEDPSVSRQHARLVLAAGKAYLNDLGSHNGIKVNGQQMVGQRQLYSGDVATLGNVTLVFHRGVAALPVRHPLEESVLRVRLAEELERVHSYERVASVAVLEFGSTQATPAELVRAASAPLRTLDLVGHSEHALVVVLPELEEEEAEAAARQILDALSPLAPQVRGGLATAPQDGLNADALIATARAAALAAPTGGLQVSGSQLFQLQLGGRTMVVADATMVRTYDLLRRLAAGSLPVLIHGETGAGKENAAWAVHHWSPRVGHPFMALNCAALPESLAESELFGYERGAFSGADKSHAGLLERASGGTLFLDEVAELSLGLQAKLLRALDQKRILRLGDSREREVDLRIVAATHRVLANEVKEGRFREDLFYRLSAAVVMLPPLRDRARELPLLARAFLEETCTQMGRPPLAISASAMSVLSAHGWPGNVRELRNVMEYATATAHGPSIEPSHLPEYLHAPGRPVGVPRSTSHSPLAPATQAPAASSEVADLPPRTFRHLDEEIRELERQRMMEALAATGGVQTRAAQLIGMPLRTFAFKAKKHRIAVLKTVQG